MSFDLRCIRDQIIFLWKPVECVECVFNSRNGNCCLSVEQKSSRISSWSAHQRWGTHILQWRYCYLQVLRQNTFGGIQICFDSEFGGKTKMRNYSSVKAGCGWFLLFVYAREPVNGRCKQQQFNLTSENFKAFPKSKAQTLNKRE